MPNYRIKDSVSGDISFISAKTLKLALKKFIDSIPLNEDNETWNFDLLVESSSKIKEKDSSILHS